MSSLKKYQNIHLYVGVLKTTEICTWKFGEKSGKYQEKIREFCQCSNVETLSLVTCYNGDKFQSYVVLFISCMLFVQKIWTKSWTCKIPKGKVWEGISNIPNCYFMVFLAHLVFYQMSLCNHDLSVVHSCCPSSGVSVVQRRCRRRLCTALLATEFKIETSYLVWICICIPNICTSNI